jgi:hypothetical protein
MDAADLKRKFLPALKTTLSHLDASLATAEWLQPHRRASGAMAH